MPAQPKQTTINYDANGVVHSIQHRSVEAATAQFSRGPRWVEQGFADSLPATELSDATKAAVEALVDAFEADAVVVRQRIADEKKAKAEKAQAEADKALEREGVKP